MSIAPADPAVPHPMRRTTVISAGAFLFLCFLLSILRTGFEFFGGNSVWQHPLALSITDPSLFPNDLVMQWTGRLYLPYWVLTGLAARVVPFEPLLLTLFLFTRALWIAAFAALVRGLGGRGGAVLVAGVFAALFPKNLAGGGTIVTAYAEHTSLAVALLLLSLAALWTRRDGWAAALLVLGSCANPIYGCFAFAGVLVPAALVRGERPARGVLVLAPGLLVALVLGLLMRAADPAQETLPPREMTALVVELMPWTTDPALWLDRMPLVFVTLAAGVWAAWKAVDAERRGIAVLGLIQMAAIAGALFAAWFFVQVLPALFPVMLQPARATDLFYPVLAAAVLAVIFRNGTAGPGVLCALAAYLLLVSVDVREALSSLHTLKVATPAIAAALVACAGFVAMGRTSAVRAALLLLPLLIAVGGVESWFRAARSAREGHTGPARFVMLPVSRGELAAREIARTARELTPPDALLGVPPDFRFRNARAESHRPLFWSYPDVMLIIMTPGGAAEWIARGEDFGFTISGPDWPDASRLTRTLAAMPADELFARSRDEGITHWILPVDAEALANSEPLARNGDFALVRVPGEATLAP